MNCFILLFCPPLISREIPSSYSNYKCKSCVVYVQLDPSHENATIRTKEKEEEKNTLTATMPCKRIANDLLIFLTLVNYISNPSSFISIHYKVRWEIYSSSSALLVSTKVSSATDPSTILRLTPSIPGLGSRLVTAEPLRSSTLRTVEMEFVCPTIVLTC